MDIYDIAEYKESENFEVDGYKFPVSDGHTLVRTLHGSSTYLNRCVAFCRHKNCYLTEKQLKSKGCLNKNGAICNRLIKCPGNGCAQFWKRREEKIAAKKARKHNDD